MNLATERSGEPDATLAMLERIYRHLVGTFPLGESLSNDVEAFYAFTAEYAELRATVERLTRQRDTLKNLIGDYQALLECEERRLDRKAQNDKLMADLEAAGILLRASRSSDQEPR